MPPKTKLSPDIPVSKVSFMGISFYINNLDFDRDGGARNGDAHFLVG